MALAASQLHDLTADEFFALADRLPRTAQLIDREVVDPSALVLRRWPGTTARPSAGFDVELKLGAGDELTSPQLPGFNPTLAPLLPR